MKVGDLVKITRSSIGVRHGSIGLALGYNESEGGYHVWEILICGQDKTRRYLEQDIEVISECR
jgi:hypothetical protein|tara:strand:- start:610 stop:798 length:189 start_codon:yes stop_codon:yes gene_type:complete